MNIRYIYTGLMAALLLSCATESDIYEATSPKEVALMAGVSVMGDTRAVTPNTYLGSSAAGMTAEVWFSNADGVYPNNPTPVAPTFIPSKTTVTYADGTPATVYINSDINSPVSYPTDNSTVYCVGLYPVGGWSCSDDNKVARHQIDGSYDIMVAPQVLGNWQNPLGTQHYTHLLTWIDVSAVVTSNEAISQWGKIKKVSVVNSHSVAEVTLGSGAVTYTGEPNEVVMLESESGEELKVVASHLGSALCAPTTAVTLNIITEKVSGGKQITIPLRDANGNAITDVNATRGKLFIIEIYFTPYDDIDATCRLIPWNEQNVDLN